MSSTASTSSHEIRARSREVVAYHKDDARPGKPLFLLIPGGLVALASFLGILSVIYNEFESITGGSSATGEGLHSVVVLLIPYFVGLLLFSYGYELYSWRRALAMTLFLGGLGITLVFVFPVLLFCLWFLISRGPYSSSGYGFGTRPVISESKGRSQETPEKPLAPDRSKPLPPAFLSDFVCPVCGRPWPKGTLRKCPYCPYEKP